MRPPKALSVLALTVLLFQTAGCRSWAPVQSELPTRPVPSGSDQSVRIRVETTDGARFQLKGGWMSSDSVGGVITKYAGGRLSFPLTQVRIVEEAGWHFGRTSLLVVGVGALTFVGVVGLAVWQGGGIFGDGDWLSVPDSEGPNRPTQR
jgi:hypothetical protein